MTAKEAAQRGWAGAMDAIREQGFNPRSLPFYVMTGRDAGAMDALAETFLPGGFLGGKSAPGTPVFFAAPEAMVAVAPLGIGGARDGFIPPSKWLRSRPDDPVNGAIWCFTAREVQAGGADLERDLAALWQAVLTLKRKVGVGFPLYVVISGNDLPGFSEFTSFLPEKAVDEVVGWVRREGVEDDWRGLGADASEMERWLAAWRDVRLYPGREDAGQEGVGVDNAYLLPGRAAKTVRSLVEAIARSSPVIEETAGIDLRGAFLVGLWKRDATQKGESEEEPSAVSSSIVDFPRYSVREAFARSLFRDKILPERWLLAASAEQARKTGSWTRRFALITVLCLLAALVARGVIHTGLDRMVEGPYRILAQTEDIRRWLLAGASGAAPVMGKYPPPKPVAIGGGAPPAIPELPELYRKNIEEYLPGLEHPSWFWKRLFRIGAKERAVTSDAVGVLGGQAVLHLAEEQIALPLRACIDRVGGDLYSGSSDMLAPGDFNRMHPPEPLPVNWHYFEERGGTRSGREELFVDSGSWNASGRALRLWIRAQLGALANDEGMRDLPDRFVRKRFLDAAARARDLSNQLYLPWNPDEDLEGFLTRSGSLDAGNLWQAAREWKRDRSGGWSRDELAGVARWLDNPPACDSPEQWVAEWRKAECLWTENAESPLFDTALSLWRRALFQWLVRQFDALPRNAQMIKDATERFAFAPSPLPRIPLTALSSASYDPVWRYRPEIWRTASFSRAVGVLNNDSDDLSELIQVGLLDSDHAGILKQTRVEPVRLAILAHARSYADYWISDIATLANPANWLLRDGLEECMPWMEDGLEEAEMYYAQTWSDFHASLAMVDARDLTRRLLANLSRRRIEALAALAEVLNGFDDASGLTARIEYALVALAEDVKLYETPEYWNAAAMTLRAWRSLGRNPREALERMGRTLARPDGQAVWESFFPVLAANFYMPETGEPVKLGYWRGFVLAALNLIQAETQRERWRGQRRLLLQINSFPWRRDAPRTPGKFDISALRKTLREVGFVDTPEDAPGLQAPELPGDAEIQTAIRGLFAGLGWGNDWLPPCNRELDARINRLAVAFSRLEEWDVLGGVPLIVLPQREQADPRHRYLRAFVMHQGKRPGSLSGQPGGTPNWELPYEGARARWAWQIRDEVQLRLALNGGVVFDFYNQTVPVPQARIGQARIADESWPIFSLLLSEGTQARPYPEAAVEADEPVNVWRARLPVRGFSNRDSIAWDFAFALPAAFGPEMPGGPTLLDDWPDALQWQTAAEEWNRFVRDDSELRIPLARDAWRLDAGAGEEWSEFAPQGWNGEYAPEEVESVVDCEVPVYYSR